MKRRKMIEPRQLSLYDDCRWMTERELVGTLSKHVEEVEAAYFNAYDMDRFVNALTPCRRRMTLAVIELYKRKEVRDRRMPN